MPKVTFKDGFESTLYVAGQNQVWGSYRAALKLYRKLLKEYPERSKEGGIPEKIQFCQRLLRFDPLPKKRKKKKK